MSYAFDFLYNFLHLFVLFIGLLIIICVGLFERKINKRYAITIRRMRIIYGYLTNVSLIISFICFIYIHFAFKEISYNILFAEFSSFSIGIYLVINLIMIILSFSSIVEGKSNPDRSYIKFISLLLVQISSFFILTPKNWIFILFGFILLYTWLNLYFRYSYNYSEEHQNRIFDQYLIINGVAISFLLIGISTYFISFGTFLFEQVTYTNSFLEKLSILLIIFALYIQMGVPPFHFWVFEHSEETLANSFIILLVQRVLSLSMFVKISSILEDSPIHMYIFWLVLSLGIIYSLWGTLGSLTLNKLKKIIHYLSLTLTGFCLITYSLLFAKDSFSSLYLVNSSRILSSVIFCVVGYVFIFTLIISLVDFISKGYGSDRFEDLRIMRREKLIPTFLLIMCLLLTIILAVITGINSGILDFSRTSHSPVFLSVSFLILILFLLITLLRILNDLFVKPIGSLMEFRKIEPAIHLSLILAISLLILLAIFGTRITEILFLMVESI